MAHLFFAFAEAPDAFYLRNDIPFVVKYYDIKRFRDEVIDSETIYLYEVIPSGFIQRQETGRGYFCEKLSTRNPVKLGDFLETHFSPSYLVKADRFLLEYTMRYQRDVWKRLTDRTKEGTVQAVLSERIKMDDLCLYAVGFHGSCLQYVAHQTVAICLEAIDKTPSSFRFCKDPGEEVVNFALKKSGINLVYIPESERTEAVCLKAVESNGLALAFVPESLQTPDICLAAVLQNPYAIQYVAKQTPQSAFRAYHGNRAIRDLLIKEYQEFLEKKNREFAGRFETETVLMQPQFGQVIHDRPIKRSWKQAIRGFFRSLF